jgi:hypothetical protein
VLTPGQQERYARHLLLDGFDQERLLDAAVSVEGTGVAAHWAARYLAASGVGALWVEDASWQGELRALGARLADRPGAHLVRCADGATPADSAMNGAQAALDLVRKVAAT